ncbi:hypothetical protein KCP73_18620 [Salmonella enterica subsp. enterica]|nr:hypothetical protein KCP73_18620 [Salmonella enterica subsp. enterica]
MKLPLADINAQKRRVHARKASSPGKPVFGVTWTAAGSAPTSSSLTAGCSGGAIKDRFYMPDKARFMRRPTTYLSSKESARCITSPFTLIHQHPLWVFRYYIHRSRLP